MVEMKKWPKPTVEEPSIEEIIEQADERGTCEATDGCTVETDGECDHGHPSWMVHLELI